MHLSKTTTALTASVLSLLTPPVSAYWRMSCAGTVFTGRVDPIVNPGAISSHVHVVLGGNGFAPNMTAESTERATCTSCSIRGDMSNYWTPLLYYRAQNGSFVSVPMAGGGQGGTVYYQQRASYRGNGTITAFPRGFRMLAGNPDNRVVDGGSSSGGGAGNTSQQAVNFACLDYSGNSHVPEGQLLPNATCPDGVRAQIYFPQCWDGLRLDSDDHRSHVAYPSRYNGGECPDSHPVPVMGLFYELLYDTARFPWWVPSDADQPFVFSMGDPTGRGFHGDFLSGWDVDVLQNGINKKTTSDAGAAGDVTYNSIFEFPDVYGTDCSLPPLVDEQIEGVLDKLPGCNPVSATGVSDQHTCATSNVQTKLAVQANRVFTDLTTSLGWKYLGCGNDTAGKPSLPTKLADSQNMTVETCVRGCTAKGFSYAGLEFASQCFCGNSLPSAALPVANSLGDCHMKCAGDGGQICGDASRLSLYQSCAGDKGKCENAFVGFVGQVGSLANNTATDDSTAAGSVSSVVSVSAVTVVPVPASVGAATSIAASNTVGTSTVMLPATGTETGGSATSVPTIPSAGSSSSTNSTQQPQLPAGWQSLGCYIDPVSPRALQGVTLAWWGAPMTTTGCAAYCSSKGFALAGTEFGEQCFCGDKLLGNSTKVDDGGIGGDCNMVCKGDGSQLCGGKGRLNLVGKAVEKRRKMG